jgi:hypothetical protein
VPFGNCLLQWVPRHADLFAQVEVCQSLLDLLLKALEPVGVDLNRQFHGEVHLLPNLQLGQDPDPY